MPTIGWLGVAGLWLRLGLGLLCNCGHIVHSVRQTTSSRKSGEQASRKMSEWAGGEELPGSSVDYKNSAE